jgi:hypothetical protein
VAPACVPAGCEVARVLRPGGVLVHVGVHPCFCGGFADRSDAEAVVIGPGYLDGHWTRASWTDQGVRHKVGAAHRPLPDLLHAFLGAGLTLERFAEGGTPTPAVLAVRARKRRHDDSPGSPPPRPSAAATTHAADLRRHREPETPTLRRWRPGRVGSPPRRR